MPGLGSNGLDRKSGRFVVSREYSGQEANVDFRPTSGKYTHTEWNMMLSLVRAGELELWCRLSFNRMHATLVVGRSNACTMPYATHTSTVQRPTTWTQWQPVIYT